MKYLVPSYAVTRVVWSLIFSVLLKYFLKCISFRSYLLCSVWWAHFLGWWDTSLLLRTPVRVKWLRSSMQEQSWILSLFKMLCFVHHGFLWRYFRLKKILPQGMTYVDTEFFWCCLQFWTWGQCLTSFTLVPALRVFWFPNAIILVFWVFLVWVWLSIESH